MRRLLFVGVVLIAVAIALWAQAGTLQLPVWNGQRYTYPRLGATLVVANGEINAVVPAAKTRRYNVLLVHDPARSGWPLPAGASNVIVRANGITVSEGVDYSVSNGVLTPVLSGLLPEYAVRADYDQ